MTAYFFGLLAAGLSAAAAFASEWEPRPDWLQAILDHKFWVVAAVRDNSGPFKMVTSVCAASLFGLAKWGDRLEVIKARHMRAKEALLAVITGWRIGIMREDEAKSGPKDFQVTIFLHKKHSWMVRSYLKCRRWGITKLMRKDPPARPSQRLKPFVRSGNGDGEDFTSLWVVTEDGANRGIAGYCFDEGTTYSVEGLANVSRAAKRVSNAHFKTYASDTKCSVDAVKSKRWRARSYAGCAIMDAKGAFIGSLTLDSKKTNLPERIEEKIESLAEKVQQFYSRSVER